MNIFSLFATVALAAETIISPLAETVFLQPTIINKPTTSFGQISGQILGSETEASVFPSPTPPTEDTFTRNPRKKSFTIALIGDSMVDTLGPEFPQLSARLQSIYPGVKFQIYNHGVGATNIDYGVNRLTQGYNYLGQDLPSVISRNPDVVVVESFGYNPYTFDTGAIDKHWLQLAAMIDIIKNQSPGSRIVIAATIAPSARVFGDGAPGLNFSPEDKQVRVNLIKQYLESTVKFAKSQNLPLADAYHPSLDSTGNGRETYINAGDHIHYSDAGRVLMAQKITEAIVNNRLLE